MYHATQKNKEKISDAKICKYCQFKIKNYPSEIAFEIQNTTEFAHGPYMISNEWR